ncbi:MAG: hypothetical protein QXF21_02905 [Thermoproteota archaeon]
MNGGKELRLSHVLNPVDGKGVILEADLGSMLGGVQGLEDLNKVMKASRMVDAFILSLGQVDRLLECFKGREGASLIVRSDWTNAYRGGEYILPAVDLRYVSTVTPEDALRHGADAVAAYLIVGYERDEDEAFNMEALASTARACEEYGLPLLVQILPVGGRVTGENYFDCVKLGVRQAVEVGGDLIAAPMKKGGESLFKELVELAKAPLMVLEDFSDLSDSTALAHSAIESNAAGVILGGKTLQAAGFAENVRSVWSIIHGG